ncbi:LuxR family two component transcriptional regulator [Ancylomarina subtilis]|uniref:LuxR family two component transcriptional regulator n=1 Tax=Ancylomarina subtilis TaxID=1639035 RepID=A0A4Q7VKV2_9BACT|nr:response regulator transcription factor [Ancylomarina subtilis]RZT96881.1 LuxR family two component transcriptional regulator [Ancylomarina subtilis]
MSKIKVVLVDDHKLFRDGLKSLLLSNQDIEVVGEFGNAKDLIHQMDKLKTEIIITDISMPGMNGIELTQYVGKAFPEIKMIILSMHINKDFILSAMEAGAKAYLPKDIAGKELIEAIYEVNQGREYFNTLVSNIIMRSLMKKNQDNKGQNELTNRETEVLILVANGLMNKEVANKLHISVRTVDCHKNNIMSKLKLNTTAELVKYAIRNHLIEI